jgi:acyl-ACP thioesterase
MTPGVPRDAFCRQRRVYLGDTTIDAELRLDAVARYLQDVAADHAAEAKLPAGHAWILRRAELQIIRNPKLYEDVELCTFCSGVGRSWAERTTVVAARRGGESKAACIEAKAIWVYVRLADGAPQPLPEEFFTVYGDGVRDHRVSARLRHAAPGADAMRSAWPLRATDFDALGHVNNAAYWEAIESALGGPRPHHAEIEFRAGIDPGEQPQLVRASGSDGQFWFEVAGDVRASVRVS